MTSSMGLGTRILRKSNRLLVGPLRSTFAGERYCIRPGYLARRRVSYFDDRHNADHWQIEVYEEALRVARQDDLRKIVDIGCGSAFKLMKYFRDFDTVGIDVSPTYEWLRETYPDRRWVRSFTPEADLVRADLVICSDVIEHVADPDALLDFVCRLEPRKIVLSTPDRSILYAKADLGPPANPTHVREWSFDEFHRYVSTKLRIVKHEISNRAQATQMVVCVPL